MVYREPGSRITHFYVIYNFETLKPETITPLDITAPDGYGRALVGLEEGEEFISFKKHLPSLVKYVLLVEFLRKI